MRCHRASRWAVVPALVVLPLSACGSHDTVSTSIDRCSAHSLRTTTSSHAAHFSGITLQVPPGWYSVKACFATAAGNYPIGYVTTQRPGPQCHAIAGGGSCGPPIDELGDHDVLVIVDEAGRSFVPPAVHTTTIDGRPASLPDSASPARNTSGGSYEMTAQIRQRNRNVLVISAYLRSDDPATEHTVLQMMRSVRLSG